VVQVHVDRFRFNRHVAITCRLLVNLLPKELAPLPELAGLQDRTALDTFVSPTVGSLLHSQGSFRALGNAGSGVCSDLMVPPEGRRVQLMVDHYVLEQVVVGHVRVLVG
jgi:hypothetical protein